MPIVLHMFLFDAFCFGSLSLCTLFLVWPTDFFFEVTVFCSLDTMAALPVFCLFAAILELLWTAQITFDSVADVVVTFYVGCHFATFLLENLVDLFAAISYVGCSAVKPESFFKSERLVGTAVHHLPLPLPSLPE